MPQKTNLNVAPFYDDFDQEKNFYKVLIRPGYSIQARELTQLQSILQNQIEQFGKYAFKQGELVIPGEVGLNTKLNFVKLSSISEIPVNQDGQIVYKKYDASGLKGQTLRGLTSGVVATVIEAFTASETASDVIYVKLCQQSWFHIQGVHIRVELCDQIPTPDDPRVPGARS